jgi:hypothetical protein
VKVPLGPEHDAVTEYTPTGRLGGTLTATAHLPLASATVDAELDEPSLTWTLAPPSGHWVADRLFSAAGRCPARP